MESSRRHPSQPIPAPKPARTRKRPLTLWLGYALIGFALLAFYYGGLAWLGFRAGDAEKTTKIAAETAENLTRQLELAQLNFSEGNYTLTQRRLDYIFSVDGDNAEALALRDELNSAKAFLLTPSPTPSPTVTPTPTIMPSPTPLPPTPDPALLEATQAEAWQKLQEELPSLEIEEQIQQLEVFRAQYPAFNNRESSQQLYDLYVRRGVDLIRGNAVERGLLLLGKAENLGDLPDEVQGEIYIAEQYIAGISYYDVNWDLYVSYFRPLCQVAPLYQDSCGKLAEGLASAATKAYLASDWCQAATYYTELAIFDPNATLDQGDLKSRIDETLAACGRPVEGVSTPQAGSTTDPGAPLPFIPTPSN
ncbi:MAG: hypothetical protein AAF902_25375 [Chloroflexota bacterium]